MQFEVHMELPDEMMQVLKAPTVQAATVAKGSQRTSNLNSASQP